MNTLTTQQKERIFATYLGQKYTADPNGEEPAIFPVIGETITCYERFPKACEDNALHLRPLSEVSNEDAILVADVCWDAALSTEQKQWMGKAVVTFFFTDYAPWDDSEFDTSRSRKQITNCSHSALIFVYQLLILLGYAVPLFVAPKHPDNGKTAIQMGIAIDSSTI